MHVIHRVTTVIPCISFYESLALNSSYIYFTSKPFCLFVFNSMGDRIQALIHAESEFYPCSIYSVPYFCSITFFKVNLPFNSLKVKSSHLDYMTEMPEPFSESYTAQLYIWQHNIANSSSLNSAVEGSEVDKRTLLVWHTTFLMLVYDICSTVKQ